MHKRTKALAVVIAMVTTFAILPTFGAAAAEPLADGSYDVTIDGSTYTVEVTAGEPTVTAPDGVVFEFERDEETDGVLNEFDVTVDDTTYEVEVEVDDDGTATVTVTEDDDVDDDTDGDVDEPDDASDDGDGDGAEDPEASEDDEGIASLDTDDEDLDDEADGEHGDLVSTVAECTPNGWIARDAGLPNQGYFVSAAARGDEVEFSVDGQPMTADLTSLAGVEAFCEMAAELVDDATDTLQDTDDDAPASEPDAAEIEAEDGDDAERGNGRGRSADAPGRSGGASSRSGDAPGRSGEAPGRDKQGN